MSARFCDGFDHYTIANLLQKWTTSAGGGPSIITGLTGVGQALHFTTSSITLTKTLDNQPSWVVGCRVRMTVASPSQTTILAFYDTGTTQAELRVNNDGTLSVTSNNIARTGGTSTNALAIGAIYYLEMKVTIADSIAVNSCRVRVNGVDWINVSAGQDLKNTTNATANSVRLSGAGQIDFDDLYVLDGVDGTATQGAPLNDFLGDVAVTPIYPTAAGSNTTWTPDTGANYARVFETIGDGDASYVQSSTINQVDSYQFSDLTGSQPIQFIQTNLTARKTDVGTRMVAAVCKSGATTDVGASVSLADTFLVNTEVRGKDPATGLSWSVSGFNAAEFGEKVIS